MKIIINICLLKAEARLHLHIDSSLLDADLHVSLQPRPVQTLPGPGDGLPLDAGVAAAPAPPRPARPAHVPRAGDGERPPEGGGRRGGGGRGRGRGAGRPGRSGGGGAPVDLKG